MAINVSDGGRASAFDYTALDDPKTEKTAREAAAFIRDTHAKTIGGILQIGARLIAIKRLMPGQFLAWVESECWFKRSTAANYMQAARYAQSRFPEKLPTIGNLEPSALYRVAHYSTSKKSSPQAIARLEEALQNGPLDLAEVDLIIEAQEQQEAARVDRIARSFSPAPPAETRVIEALITPVSTEPVTIDLVTAPPPEPGNASDVTVAANSQPLGIARADAPVAPEPASRSEAPQAPEPPVFDRARKLKSALAACTVADALPVVADWLTACGDEDGLTVVVDWLDARRSRLTPEQKSEVRNVLFPAIRRPRE